MTTLNDEIDYTKQDRLKEIIRKLHEGVPVKNLKKEFSHLIRNTSPEEIAAMENVLIQEGFPVEEVQRLCDVHASVFEASLKKVGKSRKVPGHPIHTFLQENKETGKRLKELAALVKRLCKKGFTDELTSQFSERFAAFREIEKHYQRKENQLFPKLEEKQFTGPTKVMWGKHDEIRAHLKDVDSALQLQNISQLKNHYKTLSTAIKKMIFLEEKILYPASARKLDDRDWAVIRRGEDEIGYAWIKPGSVWDADLVAPLSLSLESSETAGKSAPDKTIRLSTGELTAEQVDLMLKNLPVDITFVDENDRVRYYSDTSERIFPRSSAIIGRAVQNCHPPGSVHIVNQIVREFKEKKKDVAEFWIQKQGQFIYIRYFPIFDEKGNYRGVIEVSQEISEIRKLEGENRLLDWS